MLIIWVPFSTFPLEDLNFGLSDFGVTALCAAIETRWSLFHLFDKTSNILVGWTTMPKMYSIFVSH